MSRVACETLVTTGLIVVAGEITTECYIPVAQLARETVRAIGYDDSAKGFDCNTCAVVVTLDQQSPDIAMGVNTGGAGDQGLMFGYATAETPELMPAPLHFAHALTRRLAEVRKSGQIPWLRPDGKSQVTVEFDGEKVARIHTVVISTQHADPAGNAEIRERIIREVIQAALPAEYLDRDTIYHVNPTGRFVIGGPMGDTGLTGRKIIVDSYGGSGHHGGGAFSGKDPSKVDRSAAYMGRYIAKNIVAAGPGAQVRDPAGLRHRRGGAGVHRRGHLRHRRRPTPDRPGGARGLQLHPQAMIEALDLRRPIYRPTAAYGHFGRDGFSWERTDRTEALKAALR